MLQGLGASAGCRPLEASAPFLGRMGIGGLTCFSGPVREALSL